MVRPPPRELALHDTLDRLTAGENLDTAAARSLAHRLIGDATPSQIGALLAALRTKGVTEAELAGIATGLRDHAHVIEPPVHPVVDTCGTGGDAYDTVNVSTASAIVAAAAGATVAKHGNAAVSSSSGSADVMAELGVPIDVDPSVIEHQIVESGLGYLHAPAFHPAMRAVGPTRRELGVRTVFNLVGPLTNPAGASRQVLGVYDESVVDLVAGAAAQLGTEHALVVHGSGIDELAVHDETTVAEVTNGTVDRYAISPDDLGLDTHPLEAIAGGPPAVNAAVIRSLLENEASDAVTDVVRANAGAALYVGGEASSIAEGVELAGQAIGEGRPRRLLEGLAEEAVLP